MTSQRVVFVLIDWAGDRADHTTIDVFRVPVVGEFVDVFDKSGVVAAVKSTYTDQGDGSVNVLTEVFYKTNTKFPF